MRTSLVASSQADDAEARAQALRSRKMDAGLAELEGVSAPPKEMDAAE